MSRIPPRVTALVKTRAAGRCEYCRAPQVLIGQAFHLDHIVPRAAGGSTSARNLCLACSHCNIAKAGRVAAVDPVTGEQVLLFNPRTDVWEEHFRWSPDWTRLLGRTPVGRATAAALAMNATLLRRARPFWRVTGLIPQLTNSREGLPRIASLLPNAARAYTLLKLDELPDYYRGRNLLRARVTARHVGNAVVFFASNRTPTTGATLPVDGGVVEAFPRQLSEQGRPAGRPYQHRALACRPIQPALVLSPCPFSRRFSGAAAARLRR